MNLAVDLKFSKAEFLRWVQRQEGRYELQNGRVVMMAGGSRAHSSIYFDLAMAIAARVDRNRWRVHTAEFAVEIGEDIRYPDVLVEAEGQMPDGFTASAPVLVAEVLSPSSLHLDFGIKATEYMSLPSLQVYIVAAQDAPRVWLWERDAEGKFPPEPEIIEGSEASLNLKPLALTIPLSEVFGAILKK
jgi:Uma2 family endonuclease